MSLKLFELLPGFISAFFVNIEIGLISLMAGLIFGIPIAFARRAGGLLGALSAFLNSFLRAFPVFVLMFLVLNITQHFMVLEQLPYSYVAPGILVLSLCTYSFSAVSDAVLDTLYQLQSGQKAQALLIIPNLFRVFTILVMATSVGVAIGVRESISFTMMTIEDMPDRLDRIWTILIVILFYVIFFSFIKFLISRIARMIQSRFIQKNI